MVKPLQQRLQRARFWDITSQTILPATRKDTRMIWGIDSLRVNRSRRNDPLRISVIDPKKAKTLADKRLEPSLIDEQAHVRLVVPVMDNVGKLRQTSAPESRRIYRMLFSNKGG